LVCRKKISDEKCAANQKRLRTTVLKNGWHITEEREHSVIMKKKTIEN